MLRIISLAACGFLVGTAGFLLYLLFNLWGGDCLALWEKSTATLTAEIILTSFLCAMGAIGFIVWAAKLWER